MMTGAAVESTDIVFEQPISERVRTLLRLEFLFDRANHFLHDDSAWGRRAVVGTLLDILALFSRNDLKSEIAKELTAQRDTLDGLRDRPGIDNSRLTQSIERLDTAIHTVIHNSTQQTSRSLRESDFLMAVINRSAIPGGTSAIDLPGYHRWLNQNPARAQLDLDEWLGRIRPFEQAVRVYLEFLRASADWQPTTSERGVYVHSLTGKCQLLRVALPEPSATYPEISAGKQRFTIRFMRQPSALEREHQHEHSFDFRLALCAL